METISHIETHDRSAIQRLEEAGIQQREATAAATRFAAILKAGLGIGIAGTGTGFGALLVLYGVSLLIGRPALEEVTHAMSVQTAVLERTTNEKIAALKAEMAERMAASEKAATPKVSDERATSPAKPQGDDPATIAPGKTVVNFTVFHTQQIEGIQVVTGWKYKTMVDAAPSFQYCHVLRSSAGDSLQLPIGRNGTAIPFSLDLATKAGVTWNDVQKALPYCTWFNGVNPNIRDNYPGFSEKAATSRDRLL